MCKYCDPRNASYDSNPCHTDCDTGEPLPLFKHRIIDEGAPDAKDDIDLCVVGIVGDELVLRMPTVMGYDCGEPSIMGATTIHYCPMCGKKLAKRKK